MGFPRKIPGLSILLGLALAFSAVVVPHRTREPGPVNAEDRLPPSEGSVRDRKEARQGRDHLGVGVSAFHGLVREARSETELEDAELALGRAVRRAAITLPEERLQSIGQGDPRPSLRSAERGRPPLGGVGIDHELDQTEDLLEFVGLSEVVEVPVATARRAAEVGKGAAPDLGHGRTEAVEADVRADHTAGEGGPAIY
jgi:hypothetical protein